MPRIIRVVSRFISAIFFTVNDAAQIHRPMFATLCYRIAKLLRSSKYASQKFGINASFSGAPASQIGHDMLTCSTVVRIIFFSIFCLI
jgi:hypothetical protein